MNKIQDEHKKFSMSRAADHKLRKEAIDRDMATSGAEFQMNQKDKSIKVLRSYEFQFFDNFDTLQSLGQ